jgi:hypothetical protein
MKTAITLIVAVLISPIHALVMAGTMSKLWHWFVAPQYGDGPAYSSWYGMSIIAALMITAALSNVTREKAEGNASVDALIRCVALWLLCGLTLGTSWLVGMMCGWI